MFSGMRGIRLVAAFMMVAVAACGGQGGGSSVSDPGPGALTIQAAQPSGDNQVAVAGADLPVPVRIVALRNGAPVEGATVNWSATGAGALMVPAVGTTGADGISTSFWHLGNTPGAQTARATVAGAVGGPVAFTATALNPDGSPPGVTIELRSAGGNRFVPDEVTIPAGTTVTWTWVDGGHNVNHEVFVGGARDQARSGAPVNAPAAYSFRFITPGTYRFFCEVHGTIDSGMHGTIVVQ